MQYGVKIDNYKRAKDSENVKNNMKIEASSIGLIMAMVAGLLISRVYLDMTFGVVQVLAPFGLAYLIAITNYERKYILSSSLGVILGYITLFNKVSNFSAYIIISTIVTIISMSKLNKKARNIASFIIVFSGLFVYGVLVGSSDIILHLIGAISVTALVFPIYYVVSYTLKCIEEINTQHFFSIDEIVSIELFICLLIVGIGTLSLNDISFRNIAAILFIIVLAFISDTNMGAGAGITMGIILGFATGNLMESIAIYGACGLVAGIFRESGKLFTALSFNIIFIIVTLYSGVFNNISFIEALVGTGIFLLIPKKIYNKISLEINKDKKVGHFSEVRFAEIKDELTERLKDFTEVLSIMGKSLNNLVGNDKLAIKNKGNALVENLSDRTCSDCDMRYMCWKRELHQTYNAFSDLIRNYENNSGAFPHELEKKCIKKYALVKNLEDIMNIYMVNETLKSRLGEGRKILSNHINNMSVTISEIVDEFGNELHLCTDVEKSIKKSLLKYGINFGSLICYNDKNGRIKIKMQMENCMGSQTCIKTVLPIISETIGKNMSIGSEGCNINSKNNMCEIVIEEAPKYHINSHVAVATKEGEKFTGDSYSYGRTKDGNYITVISDGMGSGPEAGLESKVSVEIIEKFMEVGFDEKIAIDAVNAIMSIKFSEDEKFSTLDMNKIDLYTGNAKFMKVGAIESFIKRGNKVEVINSNTLPFGVLEEPDVDTVEKQVSNGDVIVSISDGILDVKNDGSFDTTWLIEFLKNTKYRQPKDLSIAILEKAKELSGGKAKDDMTVVVSKVFAIN
ncbi:stage II sporulation protein E [Clostridium perfringens]|uniref:Stage II sporulation protein E n=1 Tax=Clostridium perfringens (strain ATCC 13124 / DSM 756 / JCM 1290 / NCIMB 6125 / NCTC 8237 / Type A) TaxID=195103 RepID=A0A0H2YSU2_CLOP1|nr:stage II sporulation protein E [Clostridium perfringens]ABG84064.1 stage II sporulation protein E [Clostridium perfringens ATCC 13124]EJT5920878.1 stage II sporulation protein E [Clostridium perfringens]MDK0674810.1 stage II sporulation protein E [Clostridium perfringens]MDM0653791.1 stage II sporulation protein E [Clostridium perfringens]NGS95653.1 stage II sporulation protein E [Clostridium perfringens]